MRRSRMAVVCLSVMALCAVLMTGCGNATTLKLGSDTGGTGGGQGAKLALPTGTPQQPVGIRAIKPSKPGAIPAFTVDDVKTYLEQYPVPGNVLDDPKAVSVISIDFVSSQEASDRLKGEALGLPDSYLVCFVVLQGRFTYSGPYNPQAGNTATTTATVTTVDEIFDAQSGNLLLVGSLETPTSK